MRAALLWLALLLAGPVLAQEVTLEPSPAQRCLRPAAAQRGAPVYPEVELARKTKGRVKVELVFTSPTDRPEVKVLEVEGDDLEDQRFEEAVRDHVRSYRVPCLGKGESPAQLIIDFVFQPDHRKVYWSSPQDAGEALRQTMVACMRHETGKRGPDYPTQARRTEEQGRVLARLRFVAPDQPPEVRVMSGGRAEVLEDAIKTWALGYRMPCHSGAPVDTSIIFVFYLGDAHYGFKDTSLIAFLSAIKGIQTQRVAFDFDTMGCPFDVKLLYLQPHMPNRVGSAGNEHPARREFFDWLQLAELNASRSAERAIFGDTVTFTIPCIKINLTPKE